MWYVLAAAAGAVFAVIVIWLGIVTTRTYH